MTSDAAPFSVCYGLVGKFVLDPKREPAFVLGGFPNPV